MRRRPENDSAKGRRLRLDPLSYESLRQQILRRDGWRCQSCGTMSNLEVHHMEFRSHSGADSEENLITLCAVMPCQSPWPTISRSRDRVIPATMGVDEDAGASARRMLKKLSMVRAYETMSTSYFISYFVSARR